MKKSGASKKDDGPVTETALHVRVITCTDSFSLGALGLIV